MDEQQQAFIRRGRVLLEQVRRDRHETRELHRAIVAALGYDPFRQQRPPRIEGVAWRCEPCSRSLGRHAPALVIFERVDGPRPWVIHMVTVSGREGLAGRPRAQDRIVEGYTETNNRYVCRRCRYRPRVKAPELFALAAQAHAAGQDYFYR
jgi:hypothetical protein